VKTLREKGPKEVRDCFWDCLAEKEGKNPCFYSVELGLFKWARYKVKNVVGKK
jgi:hypothetical protein